MKAYLGSFVGSSELLSIQIPLSNDTNLDVLTMGHGEVASVLSPATGRPARGEEVEIPSEVVEVLERVARDLASIGPAIDNIRSEARRRVR